MGCCIAVALMIAWVRRAWFAARPGAAPADPGFAPAARRVGPGASSGVGSSTALDGPPGGSRPVRGGRGAAPAGPVRSRRARGGAPLLLGRATLVAAAAGVAVYAAVVAAGRGLGVVEPLATPVPWAVRDLALVLLAFVLLVLARAAPTAAVAPRGPVLVGLGAAWTALGLLDMHLLAPYVVDGGAAGDLVLHAAGSVAVLVGVTLEVRRTGAATRRPEAVR